MILDKAQTNLITVTALLFFCLVSFYLISVFGFTVDHKILVQGMCIGLIVCFLVVFQKKLFKPYLFIPFVSLAYGFMGGINFIKRGSHVDFNNELYFMLFVFFIMLTYTVLSLATVVTKRKLNFKSVFTEKASYFMLGTIVLLGLLSVLIDWMQIGGVPLFSGSGARKGSKPLFRLIYIIAIFLAYYKVVLKPTRSNKMLLGLFVVCAILSAYRTSIVFILIILFFNVAKTDFFRRNLKKILILFALLFFCINLLKLHRDVTEYGIDHYYEIMDKEELPRKYLLLSPIIHTIREGPQIFQQIRENLNGDYGKGKYFLEHISTFLPGKQRNYGHIYNNIVKAPTDNTKTGTIIAPFYIDFGIIGICFLGVILGYLNYTFDLKARYSIYAHMLYMYIVSFEITWIHGGAPFSPTFLLALVFFMFSWPFVGLIKREL